ncbi:MAG: hypothetical protein ACLGGX_04805 [Bdellovibrionia bacterium]
MIKKIMGACLCLLFLPQTSLAIKVLQIKGNRALIDLEGGSAYVGDKFFAIDNDGKKKALITILQTKSGKAVGEVNKGQPQSGFTLELARPGGTPKAAPEAIASRPTRRSQRSDTSLDSSSYSTKLRPSWGLSADVIMGSMNAKFTGSATDTAKSTSMTGTNFGFGGYYDYLLGDSTSIRGFASYQMFNLQGNTTDNDCDGSNTCKVNFSYLSGYALYRYHFSTGKIGTWLGGGGGLLLPIGATSNVINTKKTSVNFVVSAAFGMEYQTSKEGYIPFSFEYHYFPSSKSVESSMMIMRVGYGWYF